MTNRATAGAKKKSTALARRSTAIATRPRPTTTQKVRELFEQWLADKLTTSIASYRLDIAAFANFRESDDPAAAFAELIEISNHNHGEANEILFAFRHAMLTAEVWNSSAAKRAGRPADRKGLAPATINRRLAAIRSFVAVLRAAGRTEWTPEVSGVKHKKYRDTAGVGDEAVQVLLEHLEEQSNDATLADSMRAKAVRDLAIVRLMAAMALRKNGVITLDLAHVDRRKKAIYVLLKGATERQWKLCDTITWASVVRWIDVRGKDPGPLFGSFHRGHTGGRLGPSALNVIFIERTKEVQASRRAKPHGFRHTAITRALEAGLSIRDVARFADHMSLDTTLIYDDRRNDPSRVVAQAIGDYGKKIGDDHEDDQD